MHSFARAIHGTLLSTVLAHFFGIDIVTFFWHRHSDIVIKSADKGSGTVVMNRDWYVN